MKGSAVSKKVPLPNVNDDEEDDDRRRSSRKKARLKGSYCDDYYDDDEDYEFINTTDNLNSGTRNRPKSVQQTNKRQLKVDGYFNGNKKVSKDKSDDNISYEEDDSPDEAPPPRRYHHCFIL